MNLREYVLEANFKIYIEQNKIDIVNYDAIESVTNNKISLKYNNKILNIIGNDLVIKKLLNDEILIEGKLKNIELGD